jgi:hypothetical protein
MFWMMCALASAAEVSVTKGPLGVQAADASGESLNPGEFARVVGDTDVAAQYAARRQRTLGRSNLLIWGGLGAGIIGGVGAGVLSARGVQDPGTGLGLVGLGALSMGVGGAIYGVGTVSANNMDHWYTLDAAQAAAAAGAPVELPQVVALPKGFEVHYGGATQTTLAFAEHVGDAGSLRKCKAYRGLLTGVGVGGLTGGFLFVTSIRDADPGLRNELGVASGVSALAGVAALVAGNMLNRPDVWYDQDDVEGWIAGSDQARGLPEPAAVQVSVGPGLIPQRGDTPAAGLRVSGTW